MFFYFFQEKVRYYPQTIKSLYYYNDLQKRFFSLTSEVCTFGQSVILLRNLKLGGYVHK